MKVKDEKDNKDIIEGFEKFLDEKQSSTNDHKESTLNNTNTLSKKRIRENEKENENETNTKKIYLYTPDEGDSENEVKEDSSSCSEEGIFDFENYYDKDYGNEEERLENFFNDISNNKEIEHNSLFKDE